MSSKNSGLFAVWFPFIGAASIAGADIYIKSKMDTELSEYNGEPVKKGPFLFSRHHNRGAFLNLGQKYPSEVRGMSILGTAMTLLMLCFSVTKKGRVFEKTGLALILGGAVSNTYDRVKKQYVMDYVSLDVKPKKIRNIVFNLSDACIFIGSLFVMISNLTAKDRAL